MAPIASTSSMFCCLSTALESPRRTTNSLSLSCVLITSVSHQRGFFGACNSSLVLSHRGFLIVTLQLILWSVIEATDQTKTHPGRAFRAIASYLAWAADFFVPCSPGSLSAGYMSCVGGEVSRIMRHWLLVDDSRLRSAIEAMHDILLPFLHQVDNTLLGLFLWPIGEGTSSQMLEDPFLIDSRSTYTPLLSLRALRALYCSSSTDTIQIPTSDVCMCSDRP
ncbi:hypothetical protein QCA50_018032 [Cerrena zonata]|uniref:Uncharacterized protein n=1 Tax=Cerrena zonata TaxID=2478898 RepID=A0AAW0FF81_9APHY